MKKNAKGIAIIIRYEKKIPNNRLNRLNGAIIRAGSVSQYFS